MDGREIKVFKYTASAIDRIREMEKNAVVKFFDEVSPQGRTRAVANLPNPAGFRPTSREGVGRKVQLLAKRLVGEKARGLKNVQRDFDVLGRVWMMWGTECLDDANVIINEYIDRSQQSESDEIREDDEEANGDEQLAIELFERLHDLSHSNRCGREDIERFFVFSPFSETERLRRIIENCKPVEEIIRNKRISALPVKVERTEQDIAALLKTVDTLSKEREADAEKLLTLGKELETLRKVVSEGGETTSGIRDSLNAIRSEMAMQKQQAAENAIAQESWIQAAATSTKKLQNDLAAIADQIKPLFDKSEKTDKTISDINLELDQLRELIAEMRVIVNRVSVLEPPIETETTGTAREVTSTRAIELEKRPRSDNSVGPTELRNVDEFIGAVTANLEFLSIKKSSAEALALECIAALMAGQMPYFSGLSGRRVAEACATAIAAQDTYILTVPVGIFEPNEFRRRLESLSTVDKQNVGCLIIDGINRSALDTFGECLVEVVSRQRSGDLASRAMLTMATLTDGPASLPLSIAHVSLGPVFFTDTLDWRSRTRTDGQMTCGGISAEVWEEACSVAERATPETEEALRLLGEFAPFVNPLLRGTVLSGFRALSALGENRTGSTALQSLAFGWLAPLCIAAGTTADAVDQEFDQGIVDGTAPDTRLANLLRSGIFDSAQSGGI